MLLDLIFGFQRFGYIDYAVSVFGASRFPPTHPACQAAFKLCEKLASKGITIITGGGPGIMEAANEGAFKYPRKSFACSIRLPFEQNTNAFTHRTQKMRFFFTRKYMLISYSFAYIVFPGGYGTFDELFEALTLIQTGKIPIRPVYLVGSAYWRPLLDWLKGPVLASGALVESSLELFEIIDDLDLLEKKILGLQYKIHAEGKTYPINSEY